MHAAFLAVMAVMVSALVPSIALAQSIHGEWVHYMNTGLWVSGDGQCRLRLIEERRYRTSQSDAPGGGPFGMFANILHGRWVRGAPGECTHPEFGTRDIISRARTWTIDLVPAGAGRFAVTSGAGDCRGDSCDSPGLFKGSFTTVVTPSGRDLRDEGDESLQKGALLFRPLAEAQRQSAEAARQFLDRWVSMRTATDIPGFARRTIDPRNAVSSEETLRFLMRYRTMALDETHSEFEVMEAYLLAPGPGMPAEPMLSFQVANRRSDGRRTLETFELTQPHGVWMLSSVKY